MPPAADAVALALRVLRAALPDATVNLEVVLGGPEARATMEHFRPVLESDGPHVRLLRAECQGTRILIFQHKAEVADAA